MPYTHQDEQSVTKTWTPEQDLKLRQAVAQHGVRNWIRVSSQVPKKNRKQCRERWHNHLDPKIAKSPWSRAEDELIRFLHWKNGNRWAKIAAHLPGRTDNAVKNRWYGSLQYRHEDQPMSYINFLLYSEY